MKDYEQIKSVIAGVARALNTIEVHGKQNIMAILGCIGTLEDLYEKVGADEEPEKK